MKMNISIVYEGLRRILSQKYSPFTGNDIFRNVLSLNLYPGNAQKDENVTKSINCSI